MTFKKEQDIHAAAKEKLPWRKPTPVSITICNSAGGAGGVIEMKFDAEWVEVSSACPCTITQESRGQGAKIFVDLNAGQREARAKEKRESEGTSQSHYAVMKTPWDLADYLNKELREAGLPCRVVVAGPLADTPQTLDVSFFAAARPDSEKSDDGEGKEDQRD